MPGLLDAVIAARGQRAARSGKRGLVDALTRDRSQTESFVKAAYQSDKLTPEEKERFGEAATDPESFWKKAMRHAGGGLAWVADKFERPGKATASLLGSLMDHSARARALGNPASAFWAGLRNAPEALDPRELLLTNEVADRMFGTGPRPLKYYAAEFVLNVGLDPLSYITGPPSKTLTIAKRVKQPGKTRDIFKTTRVAGTKRAKALQREFTIDADADFEANVARIQKGLIERGKKKLRQEFKNNQVLKPYDDAYINGSLKTTGSRITEDSQFALEKMARRVAHDKARDIREIQIAMRLDDAIKADPTLLAGRHIRFLGKNILDLDPVGGALGGNMAKLFKAAWASDRLFGPEKRNAIQGRYEKTYDAFDVKLNQFKTKVRKNFPWIEQAAAESRALLGRRATENDKLLHGFFKGVAKKDREKIGRAMFFRQKHYDNPQPQGHDLLARKGQKTLSRDMEQYERLIAEVDKLHEPGYAKHIVDWLDELTHGIAADEILGMGIKYETRVGYIPTSYRLTPKQWRQWWLEEKKNLVVHGGEEPKYLGNIEDFRFEKQYANPEDAASKWKELKLPFTEKENIVYDVHELFANRLASNARVASQNHLAKDIFGRTGVKIDGVPVSMASRLVDNQTGALKELIEPERLEPVEKLIQDAVREVQRHKNLVNIPERSLARMQNTLSDLSPDERAFYLAATSKELQTLGDFERFHRGFRKELNAIAPIVKDEIDALLGRSHAGLRDVFGDPYKLLEHPRISKEHNGKLLPSILVDELVSMYDGGNKLPEWADTMLWWLDKYNSSIRQNVTLYFPSFHVRNVYSDIVRGMSEAGIALLNPHHLRDSINILRNADGGITIKGRARVVDTKTGRIMHVGNEATEASTAKLNAAAKAQARGRGGNVEIIDLNAPNVPAAPAGPRYVYEAPKNTFIEYKALRHEVMDLGSWPETNINRDLMKEVDRFSGRTTAPTKTGAGRLQKVLTSKAQLDEKLAKMSNMRESAGRLSYYMMYRKAGYNPRDIAAMVNRTFVDYAALSNAERQFFRRVFLFWTWNKKNLANQIRLLAQQPGRLSAQVKLGEQFAVDEYGPNEAFLPEWLMGERRLGWDPGDGKKGYITGIDLPFDAAVDIGIPGDFTKLMKNWWSMVTPAKNLFEVFVAQKDIFTGRELDHFFEGDGSTRPIADPYAMMRSILLDPLPEGSDAYNIMDGMAKIAKSFTNKELHRWLEYDEETDPNTGRKFHTVNAARFHILINSTALSRFVSTTNQFNRFMEEEEPEGLFLLLKWTTGFNAMQFNLSDQDRVLINKNRKLLEDELVRRKVAYVFDTPRVSRRVNTRTGR